jgi:hypothetical protein
LADSEDILTDAGRSKPLDDCLTTRVKNTRVTILFFGNGVARLNPDVNVRPIPTVGMDR